MADPVKVNALISRIFAVSLDAAALPPVVYLEGLREELAQESEQAGGSGKLLLSQDSLERVLFARLSVAQPPTETHFQYLVGCYRRSYEESRKTVRDKDMSQVVFDVTTLSCQLVVNYSGLLLNPDMAAMFPQSEEALRRGPCQLVDHLSCSSSSSAEPLPAGFLEQFVARFDNDGLEALLNPVLSELAKSAYNVSPLGPFHGALNALCQLSGIPATAKLILDHPEWMPEVKNGREMELRSLLGPLMKVNCLPDWHGTGQPSVNECFTNLQTRRQADVYASYQSIRMNLGQLTTGLHQLLNSLLKKGGRREPVLQWWAKVINLNGGRAKMQIQTIQHEIASHGFFCNLSAVMLKFCGPFLDPTSGRMERICPTYVQDDSGGRLDLKEVTKVAASLDEASAWVDKRNASRIADLQASAALIERQELERAGVAPGTVALSTASSSKPKEDYHFICECYFLTARCMHLGYIKIILELKECDKGLRELHRHQQELERVRSMYVNGPQAGQFERQ
ncbi:hypothetical protein CYMTET_43927, partial [Cymbomonas tetramitiformis]